MNILNFIKEIDKDNSTLYKIEMLKKGLSIYPEVLKWTNLIYDNSNTFYFTEKSMINVDKDKTDGTIKTDDLFTILLNMRYRMYDKKLVNETENKMSYEVHEFFKKCINKNLFQNVSSKLIERARKEYNSEQTDKTKMIPVLSPPNSYMRCSLMDKLPNIKYPAIAQLKSDGMFINILVEVEAEVTCITLITRSGKFMPLIHKGTLKNKLENYFKGQLGNYVYMGEMLLLDDNNKVMDRQTGNGLLTSYMKKDQVIETLENKRQKKQTDKTINEIKEKYKLYKDIENKVFFRVWDRIPYEVFRDDSIQPCCYKERFNALKQLIDSKNDNIIELTEYKEVNNLQEVKDYYKEMLSRGEEGIILKNYSMGFKNGTSNDQIKFKEIKECDLIVTGYEMGSGQFEKGIGSLICESKDGDLIVSVSGLTREMRGLQPVDPNDITKGLQVINGFDFNQYTNKIVSVEFNQVIDSKDKSVKSLFLPRIVEVRNDKSEADTLDYIMKL